jgi:hypothetical protein
MDVLECVKESNFPLHELPCIVSDLDLCDLLILLWFEYCLHDLITAHYLSTVVSPNR